MSLFEIKCPLCKGVLWVDQSTGKWSTINRPTSRRPISTNSFKAQKNPNPGWEDKFKKAQEEKARRKAEIEQKFKIARENPDELEGEVDSPFKWD